MTTATPPANPWVTSWYGLDGHGSVRYLTNSAGAVTDSYDYDAFGNLISSTGSTANNYLFAGEQFDPELGLYYNRARYLDVRSGRFWGMDLLEFDPEQPSANRYVFGDGDPINNLDPTGFIPLLDRAIAGVKTHSAIGREFVNQKPGRVQNRAVKTILSRFLNIDLPDYTRPDLVDFGTKEVYEIKALASSGTGLDQLQGYIDKLNQAAPGANWHAGTTYIPSKKFSWVYKKFDAYVEPPVLGIITYTLVDTSQNNGDDDGSDLDPSVDLALITVILIAPVIFKATSAALAQLQLTIGARLSTPAAALF